ncbi:MAG: glycosyltransferase [Thermaerobacter sp.]|nr:glycosyltransferase [Thermaerobacter sp.]
MKVLIASLPIGTGHDIAARALTESCLTRGFEVEFSHHLVGRARWETAMYFLTIHRLPALYAAAFRQADRSEMVWRRHRQNWRRVGQNLLDEVYQAHRPDVVLATHPFALSAWAALRERRPSLRLVAVLTDLSVHRFWFEPLADAYAVWLPEQVEELRRYGVPSERIWPTGIPIRASFQNGNLFSRYRQGPIILLGGGLGFGPYYRILKQLSGLPHPVLAICGHNEKLRWQLDQHRWPERVTVLGYVDHMPELLRQSRMVVGKPGGVTAAEVAQSQVPWVVTHWIPGQEQINRDRLIAHDLAVRGDTNLQAVAIELLRDGSFARQKMLEGQRLWARPLAADHIVERLAGMTSKS